MKVTVIGVVRMSGIGKESGKPFDFAQLRYLRPVEPVSGPKFSLAGFGYETGDMDLEKEALSKFGQCQFPCSLELEVENVPTRSGLKAVVVGFKPAQPVRAAA